MSCPHCNPHYNDHKAWAKIIDDADAPAREAELHKEIRALKVELAKEKHLHKLDHSLADQAKLDAEKWYSEANLMIEALVNADIKLDTARHELAEMTRERDAAMTVLRGIDSDGVRGTSGAQESWELLSIATDRLDAATAEAGVLRLALKNLYDACHTVNDENSLEQAEAALNGSAGQAAMEKMIRYEKALNTAAPHVCSLLCPSTKKTGQEWTHSIECEKVHTALHPATVRCPNCCKDPCSHYVECPATEPK